ncbi:MAG: AzlD domain-containing protein [Massilia sp.]
MAEWEIWVTIGALVLATATCRSAFWLVGHHINIPKRVQEMLRYAPACALAAIIAPDLLLVNEHPVTVGLANPKLLAAVAASAYYLWRKNMLETIVLGMLVFTALRIALH